MKEKRGWKEYLKFNFLSLFLIISLIILTAVLAGDVIIKEGDVEISNDLNSSGVFYVDSVTDRVGIGTSNPSSNLEIFKASLGTGVNRILILNSSTSFAAAETGLGWYNSNDGYYMGEISLLPGSMYDNAIMYIKTDDGTHSLKTRMTINKNGNVSIGTTVTTHTLTVNGTGNFTGTLIIHNNTQIFANISARTCDTGSEGSIYYDGSIKMMFFCNGTAWTNMSAR